MTRIASPVLYLYSISHMHLHVECAILNALFYTVLSLDSPLWVLWNYTAILPFLHFLFTVLTHSTFRAAIFPITRPFSHSYSSACTVLPYYSQRPLYEKRHSSACYWLSLLDDLGGPTVYFKYIYRCISKSYFQTLVAIHLKMWTLTDVHAISRPELLVFICGISTVGTQTINCLR